jgi:hypothetical protein
MYFTDAARSLPQWLRKSYKAIYGPRLGNVTMMITNIFCRLMDTVEGSGAATTDRVEALQGKYKNPCLFLSG